MKPKLFTLIISSLLFSSFYLSDSEKPTILEELLEVKEITLDLPLDSILAFKNKDESYTAQLTYKTKDKVKRNWNIELKTRGKYRKRVCSVPPLSIRFSKEDLKAAGFKKKRKVKLVTPCLSNWESDEYVLREYLAYKLYELVSDKHLRTQIVKIKYKNTMKNRTMKRYGILIEDEDEMADRFDANLCEDCFNYDQSKIDGQSLRKHDLFQFMIGNTDYSLKMVRNMKLLIPKDSSAAFVIPYDFDFCGLVNAPYSVPNSNYKLNHCRERRFLGDSEKDDQLKLATAIFKGRKKDILKYVSKFGKLSRESRIDILDYLDSFFECIEKGELLNYTPENMELNQLETDKD
jgi:hypothetical protein